MNKELCPKVQTALLTLEEQSAPLPLPLQEHLDSCQSCQEFHQVLSLLGDAPRPSSALEEKTRQLCHQALASRRRSRGRKLFLWFAAAAALLILSGTLVLHLPQRPSSASPTPLATVPPTPGNPWEDLLLDTEFSLANADISSLELQLDLLVVDLL